MSSVAVLIVLMLITYGFLQQRRQDERAIALARQLCQQQQIQYLDCARDSHKLTHLHGKRVLRTLYLVEFSGDGESRYQAQLWMKGLRLADFVLPAFKI